MPTSPSVSATGPHTFYAYTSLPGAWPSKSSLFLGLNEDDAQKDAPESLLFDDTFLTDENAHPALSKTARNGMARTPTPTDSPVCYQSSSVSLIYDDESIPSDDFYSFISLQDADTTLLSNVTAITPGKETDESETTLGPLHLAESTFDSSELSSSLHGNSAEEETLSDDASSEVSEPLSTRLSVETPHLALQDESPKSCSQFQSNSASQIPPSSPVSPESISSVNISSASSMGYAEEDSYGDSVRSDYSVLNYAGVCNLIERLRNDSAASEESVAARLPNRAIHSGQGHRQTSEGDNLEIQCDTLLLSQPDGDNPWTLFLDPTLTSPESISQSSMSSLFVALSPASEGEAPSRRYPASLSRASSSPHTDHYRETEVSTARQPSDMSIYEEPLEQRSGPLLYVAAQRLANSEQTSNVIQKTKDLCRKIKRFLTPKPTRQITRRRLNGPSSSHNIGVFSSSDAPRETISIHHYSDVTPSEGHIPRPSTPSWSIYRRAFTKSAKVSSPSAAFSCTPEYVANYTASTMEERYTYEYHARPKTLEEIRSKRRFSLPSALSGASSRPSTSIGRNFSILRRHRNKGSISLAPEIANN